LSLTFIAQSLNYAYGSLLSATGHIGKMNKIYAVGILLNIGGNWLILPYYGATGAAAVTLVTQSFVGLTQAVLAHKWLSLPAKNIAWGKTLLFALLFCTCARALQMLGLPYYFGLPLLGFGGLTIASLIGLIDVRELTSLGANAGASKDQK
jgi:O-antigen/teichoic acid export membrane protein